MAHGKCGKTKFAGTIDQGSAVYQCSETFILVVDLPLFEDAECLWTVFMTELLISGRCCMS
jgi:hypothetical protein